jgi:hypothetical protein
LAECGGKKTLRIIEKEFEYDLFIDRLSCQITMAKI